jgi:hypothetical protein
MSVGSLVGGAVVTGVVLYVIGLFFWAYGGKKLFWVWYFRKQIPRAREFLKELDKEYPRDTVKKDVREQREIEIARVGFNKYILEHSDKLNQKERINNGTRERKGFKGFFKRRAPDPEGTTGADTKGTDDRGVRNRDDETERKRILPLSTPAIDDGKEQPSKWDWASFSKGR